MFYVGIDWADQKHHVFIVDEEGREIEVLVIPHDYKGLSRLRDSLRKLAAPKDQILIALETSKGLLVDFLLQEGFTLYPINPKAVDRYRDRYRASQAKSDFFDALVLANILRTDRERFRPLLPDTPLTRELRILTRDQQHLITMQTRLVLKLEACLKDYYPVALGLFSELCQPLTLDFLETFPQPAPVSLTRLKKFFREHHYPQPEQKAKEVYEKLTAPQIPVEEFTIRAKSRLLLTLIAELRVLSQQLKGYDREIARLFCEHADHPMFQSLPGAGPKIGPRLLAQMGDNRDRYTTANQVQGEAGTAPVTRASGKYKIVILRRACRKPFRNVVHQFAFCSLRESKWARQFYDQQITSGKTHAEALRALGHKWLKIIFRLWQDRVLYDESYHLARLEHYKLGALFTT